MMQTLTILERRFPGQEAKVLRKFLEAQPRETRVFNDSLELIWDSVTNRAQCCPIFRDSVGEPIALPETKEEQAIWPVRRAFEEQCLVEREYEISSSSPNRDLFCRIRAFPFQLTEDTLLIIEETELVDHGRSRKKYLEQLDLELTELIHKLDQNMINEEDFSHFRLRLENPNLQRCYSVKDCPNELCPAFAPDSNPRCWEINETHCPEGLSRKKSLGKLQVCIECEVFLRACPDLLTRVGEKINHLLHMIELKHRETQKAHLALQKAEKMAALGELTAGMAHEIKNPLSIILSRLDCLSLEQDVLSPAEIRGDMEVMHDHAERIQGILDKFFNMARVFPPKLEWLQVEDSINEMLTMMNRALHEAHIQVKVDLPGGLPRVYGDATQLQQVFLNILINARDAMPEGGLLTIRGRSRKNPVSSVEISIADTGEGIPLNLQENVFSPFYTTKADKGGTGLGLAVNRRIMKQHGGNIYVESQPGEGATFILWFPIIKK